MESTKQVLTLSNETKGAIANERKFDKFNKDRKALHQ